MKVILKQDVKGIGKKDEIHEQIDLYRAAQREKPHGNRDINSGGKSL